MFSFDTRDLQRRLYKCHEHIKLYEKDKKVTTSKIAKVLGNYDELTQTMYSLIDNEISKVSVLFDFIKSKGLTVDNDYDTRNRLMELVREQERNRETINVTFKELNESIHSLAETLTTYPCTTCGNEAEFIDDEDKLFCNLVCQTKFYSQKNKLF